MELDNVGSSAILRSLEESSVASQRKRGPVAFRPRLSAGLALSLLSSKRSTEKRICQSVNLIWRYFGRLERPLWVISGHSPSYQFNVRFRAYSGRSTSQFRESLGQCLLSPKAVIHNLSSDGLYRLSQERFRQ